MFRRLISEFEKANPNIKVRIEGAYRDQSDQFQATLRQGLIGQLPDVSFQGYAYLPMLKQHGYTVRLDDFLANDPNAKEMGLSGAVVNTGTVEGESHGLGVGMSFPIIYVNAGLAKRVGENPNDLPGDWDGILGLTTKIGSLGGNVEGGFFQYRAGGNWTWIGLLESLGGRMLTPDRKIGFTGRPGLRSLEIIQTFGKIGQSRYDVSQDEARAVFGSGLLGTLVDSSSSLASFEAAANGRFEIRTIPFPLATPDGRVPAAGDAIVLHTREPSRQKAAWAFMQFVCGPQGQTLVGQLTGYTPANIKATETPNLLGNYYRQRPSRAAANASAAHAGPWFSFPGNNSIKVSDAIRDKLHDLVSLNCGPADTLSAIEKSVRKLSPGLA